MAKRIFNTYGQTFSATAVTTTLTNSTYMGIQGGNATQVIDILEILASGMASASTLAALEFVPASTAPTTPTALAAPATDGPLNTSATALSTAATTYFAAGTGPQASALATVPRLNLSLNAFGGIIRWNAAPTQQLVSIGNAVNVGTWVLYNNSTQGGGVNAALNAHIVYEPY